MLETRAAGLAYLGKVAFYSAFSYNINYMKTYKYLAAALLVASVFAIYFISKDEPRKIRIYKKVKAKKSPSTQNAAGGPADVAAALGKDGTSATTADSTSAPIYLDVGRGLCFYSTKEMKAIALDLARHIRKTNPKQIALPYSHGSCLKDLREAIFSIVDYDSLADVAFNQFGSVNLGFAFAQEYISYDEFQRNEGSAFADYGFPGPQEMAKFFSNQAYFRFEDKRLLTFKINQISNWRPRAQAGAFETYPGVEFISLQDANRRAGLGASFIDLSYENEKFLQKAQGMKPKLPIIESSRIVHPSYIEKAIPSEVFKDLPKDKEVVLMGSHARDLRVYNLTSYFYAHGYPKVSVVKGGLYAANNIIAETPMSIAGLNIVSVDTLLQDTKKYIILDTRNPALSFNYSIEGSYSVPFQFPMTMKRDHKFFKAVREGETKLHPLLEPQKALALDKLKMFHGGKPILLISSSEFEWAPIILALYIKSNLNVPIYWLREGMDKVELLHQLGFVSDEQLAKARIIHNGNIIEKKIPAKDGSRELIFRSVGKKMNHDLRPRRK